MTLLTRSQFRTLSNQIFDLDFAKYIDTIDPNHLGDWIRTLSAHEASPIIGALLERNYDVAIYLLLYYGIENYTNDEFKKSMKLTIPIELRKECYERILNTNQR